MLHRFREDYDGKLNIHKYFKNATARSKRDIESYTTSYENTIQTFSRFRNNTYVSPFNFGYCVMNCRYKSISDPSDVVLSKVFVISSYCKDSKYSNTSFEVVSKRSEKSTIYCEFESINTAELITYFAEDFDDWDNMFNGAIYGICNMIERNVLSYDDDTDYNDREKLDYFDYNEYKLVDYKIDKNFECIPFNSN